jgi:hypothetical protein
MKYLRIECREAHHDRCPGYEDRGTETTYVCRCECHVAGSILTDSAQRLARD